MEIGTPQSILFPSSSTWDLDEGSGCTEIVFNNFDTTPTSLAFPGVSPTGGLRPKIVNGGILVQQLAEDPAVRTAIDNRAHKSGGIMHTFYRGPRYTTLEAMILGDNPSDREQIAEYLRGALQNILDRDGRYLYKPSNAATRFLTIRHYEALKIAHSTSTTGAAVGVSAPKSALVTLVSADWAAYTYGTPPVTMSSETETIANNGNTDMWPVLRLYGPDISALLTSSITLTNHTTGELVSMVGNIGLAFAHSGSYWEVDMLNETIYFVDGRTGERKDGLATLDPTVSDFWRIPPGGASISSTVVNFAGDTIIYARDAWA